MNILNRNSSSKNQSGLALVELLIAMLLGLILVGGILQMFSSSRQTHRVHEATARMQESGRMALEVIARDIRMADFWGCSSDISNVVNNLDSTGAGFLDFAAGGVGGTEGGAGVPDTLVLRGGFDRGLDLQPPYGPQSSANVAVSAGNGLEQGDFIFVSDCTAGDIFQVTNANPDGTGTIVHNIGETVSPGNYNVSNPGCPGGGNAHCLSKVYGADATLFSVQELTYSIAPGSEGEPALFRNGAEFLDGVEDFQILFGEDTDALGGVGSGVANYYVSANQVIDMNTVVGIRFAIVTRSRDDNLTGGANQNYSVLGEARTAPDQRIRQTYMTTVTIRNRL